MIGTGVPGDQHVATVVAAGPMDHPAAHPDSIRLRGGFSISEWIAVGSGSIIAAVGLGIVTGSASLGLLIGAALLVATWAILLLI